ncbi:hypothetical protein SCHPADRAFT_340808 [Schizopora paradoxa]|uniref:Uncharacterized protein n=1 Tax=Schizopora paradoxa TaxID=27342 RepID=A0A0H2RPS4_9AGAM|nr:hypothetical protein SCHPADRAFT_340808 [Schizopora paradoxa]
MLTKLASSRYGVRFKAVSDEVQLASRASRAPTIGREEDCSYAVRRVRRSFVTRLIQLELDHCRTERDDWEREALEGRVAGGVRPTMKECTESANAVETTSW